jgi:hypothetical protein
MGYYHRADLSGNYVLVCLTGYPLTLLNPYADLPLLLRDSPVLVGVAVKLDPLAAELQVAVNLQLEAKWLQFVAGNALKSMQMFIFVRFVMTFVTLTPFLFLSSVLNFHLATLSSSVRSARSWPKRYEMSASLVAATISFVSLSSKPS